MKTMNIKALSAELVIVRRDEPVTNSVIVAQSFGKRHNNVMAAIERTIGNGQSHCLKVSSEIVPEEAQKARIIADFAAKNIIPSTYIDERGKERKMYLLTEAGFIKVVNGFTGQDADFWQILFINEFEAVKRQLRSIKAQQMTFDWATARQEGKETRKEMTATGQLFVAYCTERGSKNAKLYYVHLTKMVYLALFEPPKSKYAKLRDALTTTQLRNLAVAERVLDGVLADSMTKEIEYHEVYKHAKEKVMSLAAILGKEAPGLDARELQAIGA